MQAMKKVVLPLIAAALAALAFGAVPAQAQVWAPADEDFTAFSANSEFEYPVGSGGLINFRCDSSNAAGNTGPGTDGASLDDLTFGIPPDCNDCDAPTGASVEDIRTGGFPWTIRALTPTDGGVGEADIEMPSGGFAEVDVSVIFFGDCTIHIDGPQTIGADVDEGANPQELRVGNARGTPDPGNVTVTRTGTSQCGPAGPQAGTFSGTYEVDSDNPISIE